MIQALKDTFDSSNCNILSLFLLYSYSISNLQKVIPDPYQRSGTFWSFMQYYENNIQSIQVCVIASQSYILYYIVISLLDSDDIYISSNTDLNAAKEALAYCLISY